MAVIEWFGVVGLFFDIVGAFYLAKAVFLKSPALVSAGTFPEKLAKAKIVDSDCKLSRHGVPVFYIHKLSAVKLRFQEFAEASIGVYLLIVGFSMQILSGFQSLEVIPYSGWVLMIFLGLALGVAEYFLERYKQFKINVSIEVVLLLGGYNVNPKERIVGVSYDWGHADNFMYDVAEHLMPEVSYQYGLFQILDGKNDRADWLREEIFRRYHNCELPELVYKQTWYQTKYYESGCRKEVNPLV